MSVDGEWGTVCDNNWNLNEANLVCQLLGYDGAWTAYYQPGEGLVKVEEPQCTGREPTLLDCRTAQTIGGNSLCSHGRDVAVECRTSTSYSMADACMHALYCRHTVHTQMLVSTCFVSCLDSAALEVVYVTTDSIVLHFLVRDCSTGTTFNISVDGLHWAQTMKTVYMISGLVSDREYILTVDVIQSGRIVTTLHQSARTQKLGEYFTFQHSQCTHFPFVGQSAHLMDWLIIFVH